MIYKIIPASLLFVFSFFLIHSFISKSENKNAIAIEKTTNPNLDDANVEMVYNHLHSNQYALPKLESFAKALKGYYE